MDNATMLLLLIAAVVVVAVLWFRGSLRRDGIDALVLQGQAKDAICSRAELVDGGNHIAVALGLEPEQITYRSRDFEASIEIRQIDEVEYGSDLVTGAPAKGSVLRLRSHGRALEFVLDSAVAERWSHRLPPHRMNETGQVHSV